MGKLRNGFKYAVKYIKSYLRQICGNINPQKRIVIVIVMLVVFGVLSMYMIIDAVYRFGQDDEKRLEIKRIEGVMKKLKKKYIPIRADRPLNPLKLVRLRNLLLQARYKQRTKRIK